MSEKTGKRIELLIFEKGFPSIRQFARYIKEKDPESYISEDTISNLIKGKSTNTNTLQCIAHALDLPLPCLTSENLSLVDDYLFKEVADEKNKYYELIKNDKTKINNLDIVKNLYTTYKSIYPDNIQNETYESRRKITTLAEISIYFPLFNMHYFIDIIGRISGQIESYENYILDQYQWLYERIPDSPAKRFADCQVITLKLSNKQNLSKSEQTLLDSMEKYAQSQDYLNGYKQYCNIIKKLKKLYNNDIIIETLCNRFPEIYIKPEFAI